MNMHTRIFPVEIPFEIPLPGGERLSRSVGCYLVTGEDAALIDTGVAGAWKRINDAMRENGIDPCNLRHLLFTHAHPDHIGAAVSILQDVAPNTHAHADAIEWIEDPDTQKQQRPVPGFDTLVEGGVKITQPLADGKTLDLGGIRLTVLATPGHARGHLAFYCPEASALFSGDAIPEPNALPIYTDLPATLHSMRQLQGLESVEALYSSWERPIHGREAIQARFEDAFNWIQVVHEAVRNAVHENRLSDWMSVTRHAMEMLGLPPFAANPLTAATVQTHMTFTNHQTITGISSAKGIAQ